MPNLYTRTQAHDMLRASLHTFGKTPGFPMKFRYPRIYGGLIVHLIVGAFWLFVFAAFAEYVLCVLLVELALIVLALLWLGFIEGWDFVATRWDARKA